MEWEVAMPKANIMLDNSSIVGNIAFEIQYFYARGGPDFPLLGVTLDLTLWACRRFRQGAQPTVHPLTCVLLAGEFCSPPERAVAGFRDEIGLFAQEESPPRTAQVRLEVPLDLMKVGRIEQSRSGELRVGLTFRPLLAIHSQDLAVQEFQVARVDALVFAVPKSQWVEQLLPQLGYGGLELLEVRITSNVRPEGLPQSVQELRQAQKYLNEGDWEKAVEHCRKAVEAIPESRNLQLPPGRTFGAKVDTLVNEHLKGSLGEKQAKLVADEMKLIWDVSSKAAHPATPGYFKRPDAEFMVRNTMALVEYFGKVLS
jgi:hypothetical protein